MIPKSIELNGSNSQLTEWLSHYFEIWRNGADGTKDAMLTIWCVSGRTVALTWTIGCTHQLRFVYHWLLGARWVHRAPAIHGKGREENMFISQSAKAAYAAGDRGPERVIYLDCIFIHRPGWFLISFWDNFSISFHIYTECFKRKI